MSFRQKNEGTQRKWDAFYQANIELIERIGLPGPTIDTWDRFADLLMHGIIDHHDDWSGFNTDKLSPEKRELFKELVDRYLEAGFRDVGMHYSLIGGIEDWVKLVKKYPSSFSAYDIQKANEWEENEV
jgi:hypothetical protein